MPIAPVLLIGDLSGTRGYLQCVLWTLASVKQVHFGITDLVISSEIDNVLVHDDSTDNIKHVDCEGTHDC